MSSFILRRAVERLRDGLFDPIAVNRLTMEKDRAENVFSSGLKGESNHLCICGSYGQGKSHTLTHLNQFALLQDYATSVIPLDLKEVPFHQFSIVYQSIMEHLSLPDGEKFTSAWKNWADQDALGLLDTMPHRFRMILTAMISQKKTSLKKPEAYRPKEHRSWLDRALMGYNIPAALLKNICKYRDIEGYREQPLNCRGNDAYFQMVQSLGRVLKEMGYKGLLLFFDEAESITQGRLGHRVKSYHLLDQFFQTKSCVFPVFAFTDDFFDKVKSEPYDKEIFPKNYAEDWRNLNILRLSDFSSDGWDSLLDRLMELYSQAYHIDLSPQVKPNLQSLLGRLEAQETRAKLKALVNKLDIETQHI
jgi:hypothetical protein